MRFDDFMDVCQLAEGSVTVFPRTTSGAIVSVQDPCVDALAAEFGIEWDALSGYPDMADGLSSSSSMVVAALLQLFAGSIGAVDEYMEALPPQSELMPVLSQASLESGAVDASDGLGALWWVWLQLTVSTVRHGDSSLGDFEAYYQSGEVVLAPREETSDSPVVMSGILLHESLHGSGFGHVDCYPESDPFCDATPNQVHGATVAYLTRWHVGASGLATWDDCLLVEGLRQTSCAHILSDSNWSPCSTESPLYCD